jgi:hypothetical protein
MLTESMIVSVAATLEYAVGIAALYQYRIDGRGVRAYSGEELFENRGLDGNPFFVLKRDTTKASQVHTR